MWYVVHLIKPQKNVVIPQKWVRQIEDHLESFLNYRINTSQVFLVYFSTEEDAFIEGHPNEDFEPKFNMEVDGRFPDEGCYTGRILKVKSKY